MTMTIQRVQTGVRIEKRRLSGKIQRNNNNRLFEPDCRTQISIGQQ